MAQKVQKRKVKQNTYNYTIIKIWHHGQHPLNNFFVSLSLVILYKQLKVAEWHGKVPIVKIKQQLEDN
jgi:hypothetical protein